MTQESQKEIPPHLQVLLTVARSLHFVAGNLMFITQLIEWRAKGFGWAEPSTWFVLLGLILMSQAFFGLTYRWLSTLIRVRPVMVSYTLWSMVVTGAGFLMVAIVMVFI